MTEENKAMEAYVRAYMAFVSEAKTEREAVALTIERAEAAGYRAYVPGAPLAPGDKIYRNNREKSVFFAHIGTRPLSQGAHIAAAHLDSPRLDLKPEPLHEDGGLSFLKTNYYGSIKKYQWVTLPLALHGRVICADGRTVDLRIGEKADEPVFYVSDLLVHLAEEQMKKALSEGVTGEQLRLLAGACSKNEALKTWNARYGVTGEDFRCAELCAVPAGGARRAGLDGSLICAYGHDDKACAYACFAPLLTQAAPAYTSVCLLADKEEIGSVGVTGLQGRAFDTFMEDLCAAQGTALRRCYAHSFCLSADASGAYDPAFASTSDSDNTARLGGGLTVSKYTGAHGKSGASDASAEALAYLRGVLAAGAVTWQTATLGKVDQGGGGTVAAYLANRDISTVDVGIPLLSMHAPYEIVAASDCHMAARAMAAFYENTGLCPHAV